ncbi:NAD(P)-dependent alcohol dehydrogenase [Halobacillus fulvus]|nr:NAD(P)-dependent alcohol dehydrogenase [Halobacillus fulvus]
MKAVVCTRYGPPEVLQIEEVAKPVPKADQILVKVYATAVNSGDLRVRSLDVPAFGRFPMQLILGFQKPRKPVLGIAFAGEVAEIGSHVKQFKVGDRVYAMAGMRMGGYAEYACVPENGCVHFIPEKASFEEAASLPFGATTALHFLRKVNIERANSILIYGASGAVGTAAVQIARYYGAEVTAICSSKNADLVKELGADHWIDYTDPDFVQKCEMYDAVFDAVGKWKKKEADALLYQGGRYTSVAGYGVARELKQDLVLLNSIYESGDFKAVIDKVYPMEDIVEAHRYVDSGRKRGNVVVRVVHQEATVPL